MNLTTEQIYFYKTFGFLKLENIFSKKELNFLSREFNSDYENFFQTSIKKILFKSVFKGRTYMVPSFADNNRGILNCFYDKGFFGIAKQLLGENIQYWGSDGSLFSYNSMWHRDTATIAKRCKINVYLNSGRKNSGAFRIIPGSQNIGDEYTNLLGNACAWPSAPVKGGLNEKNLLPESKSPNDSIWKFANFLKGKPEVPHHVINFNEGDVLIFDDRALHCVYAPYMPKPRRLITMLFTEFLTSPRSIASSSYDLTDSAINKEIIDLKQMECNQYSVPAFPEGLIRFLSEKGGLHYVDKLKDLGPTSAREYDGVHKEQHIELREFLVKNYRKVNAEGVIS